MWMFPKPSSKGGGASSLMFLWTYCCSFTSIYFAWPMTEPWKLENKLLFSKSCQRWLQSQRELTVGQTFFLIRSLFAALLSPQLHTCPWKPFVYLVYVGSPRRCHQSGRWERCPFDTPTMVIGKKREKERKRKLAEFWAKFFKGYCYGHRKNPVSTLFISIFCALSNIWLSKIST